MKHPNRNDNWQCKVYLRLILHNKIILSILTAISLQRLKNSGLILRSLQLKTRLFFFYNKTVKNFKNLDFFGKHGDKHICHNLQSYKIKSFYFTTEGLYRI